MMLFPTSAQVPCCARAVGPVLGHSAPDTNPRSLRVLRMSIRQIKGNTNNMLQFWQNSRNSHNAALQFNAASANATPSMLSWAYWQANPRFALHILCYLFIGLAIVYRIDYIIEFNPIHYIFSDTQRHWEQGVDVLRGDPMVFTDPILFQVYIAVLAKLTLKYPPLVAFYTILLCCLTPWLWYRFVRELHPSKTLALTAWAVLSWNPSWISIYGYFMQETIFLPLLGAALWATWRCKRKQTSAAFTVMVLLWAMAGLARGIAIPMAAVACTWLWLLQTHKVKKAVYSIIVLALILGPLTYRGYQFVHIFAPHGMGNMNLIYAKSGKRKIKINYERQGAKWFYIFQSPAVEAKVFEPFSEWHSQRDGEVKVFVDLEEGSRDWDIAFDHTTLTFRDYISVTLDNMILLFFAESWPDSDRRRLLGEINYQSRWIWAPLALLVLVGSILLRKRLRDQRLFMGMIVAFFVVQALLPIAVNEGRYRMPLTGLLLVQALLLISAKRAKPGSTGASTNLVSEPHPVNSRRSTLSNTPPRRFPSRSGVYRPRTTPPRKRGHMRAAQPHTGSH